MSAVEALVCNLVRDGAGECGLLIILGWNNWSGSRYSPPHFGPKTLKAVLDVAEGEFLRLGLGRLPTNGEWRGTASRITPTSNFANEARLKGISNADLGRDDREEMIILSRNASALDWVNGAAQKAVSRERLDYIDTPETNKWREELREMNAVLAGADLAFEDDGRGHVRVSDRRLRRYFSLPSGCPLPRRGVPHMGGRLFGAFWSNLDKERRAASLRIDGECIAEVDANALFTRLAYASAGRQLDDADPYDQTAELLAAKGFSVQRGAIKKAVNALFFGLNGRRWPGEIETAMPHGLTVATLRAAVLETLPDLAPFIALGTNAGYGFMFTESEIILDAMKELTGQGVVALPLHDALLCAESKSGAVQEAFAAAALKVTGVRIKIGVK
ncbi:hypothetical protein [Methylocella silvestris]|nr:hypothetical protein [Methylocella silvestris]